MWYVRVCLKVNFLISYCFPSKLRGYYTGAWFFPQVPDPVQIAPDKR